jgi:hypothetical protein
MAAKWLVAILENKLSALSLNLNHTSKYLWKVNNGSMFPVLVFSSHFQILLVRKPDTRPECFTTRLVAPFRWISLVYNTQYVSTQNDIWTPEAEISDLKFPFCPSAAPHVCRYDVASCTSHTFTGVASLCWT